MKNIVILNKENRNSTRINFKDNVPYISYRALADIKWLKNGFSTRLGGVSEGVLSTMNLGFGRNDLPENVVKNHEIIANAIGFNPENIVASKQTHTTNVKIVSKKDCGKGIYRERDYDDVDGMITNGKGIVLATYFADCVPLYMVDTKNKAIGLSHSGWRGTVGKIGKVTLDLMKETYGTNPKDVIACIGPSICRDCYEVSEDVATEFEAAFKGRKKDILINKGNGKYQLDLWECNYIIFKECGVYEENIHMPDICTCHNMEMMFSHRATQGRRGNLAAFLSIDK
ncbi:peptidoglycan editing factor PgeF [Eubacterium sp. AF15-50]|uniref:peptidoglycan editing factor PgeF n=1 Tax=Eubacterium sp. AF15-50 TaxID=2293103 RepID=UPI002672C6E5|nr:peptidoglycan editing factor PgeF [Eubacterium sp. AF15-50]